MWTLAIRIDGRDDEAEEQAGQGEDQIISNAVPGLGMVHLYTEVRAG